MRVTFPHFDQAGGVRYGVSDATYGSMRPDSAQFTSHRDAFFDDYTLPLGGFQQVKQTHSNKVVVVSDKTSEILEADGIVTGVTDVALSIVTADCVPLFLYDNKAHVTGLVHAGWKGVARGIVAEAIAAMQREGSSAEDIMVGIGPSIRSCCYDIDEERTRAFQEAYDANRNGLLRRNGKWYLSLQNVIVGELVQSGVAREKIEDSVICTACPGTGYFSYRGAEDKTEFPEFMSAISLV